MGHSLILVLAVVNMLVGLAFQSLYNGALIPYTTDGASGTWTQTLFNPLNGRAAFPPINISEGVRPVKSLSILTLHQLTY